MSEDDDDDDDEDEDERARCGNRYCFCTVGEGETYCSERCRKATKSERPSYECKCDHEDCEDDD